jgi:hypothetical protein
VNVTDIDSVEQFFIQEVSMMSKIQTALTKEQTDFILTNFDKAKKSFSIKNFMKMKVKSLPDRTALDRPLIETGLVVPGKEVLEVSNATTYQELYSAVYKQYAFPPQSLYENVCVAFCPDGFASVGGYCQGCLAPCATCKTDVKRCLTCRQTPGNKLIYSFGRTCYEQCPDLTVTDEKNKRCLGCASGCQICTVEN